MMKKFGMLFLIMLVFFSCNKQNELDNEIVETTVSYDGVMLQNTLDVISSMIVENSTVTYVDDDGRVRNTAMDGCRLFKPSSYMMLSITKREYYTYPNIQ